MYIFMQTSQENYHVWTVFRRMAADPESNLLGSLPHHHFVELRRLLILTVRRCRAGQNPALSLRGVRAISLRCVRAISPLPSMVRPWSSRYRPRSSR